MQVQGLPILTVSLYLSSDVFTFLQKELCYGFTCLRRIILKIAGLVNSNCVVLQYNTILSGQILFNWWAKELLNPQLVRNCIGMNEC